MELKDELTSFKLSKQLRKLGVKQYSLFHWMHCNLLEDTVPWIVYNEESRLRENKQYYSAFSVAELMEMLPENIYREFKKNCKTCLFIQINKQLYDTEMNYICGYYNSDNVPVYHIDSPKLADVLAEMLIHLIKNKLIKL